MDWNISASVAECAETLRWLQAGLDAVNGQRVVWQTLAGRRWHRAPALIAVGKAASAMLEGALDALAQSLQQPAAVFCVTKDGHVPARLRQRLTALPASEVVIRESAHPVPDHRSLAAGEALVDWIARLPEAMPVIVLISGGASSLVEALQPGVTLAQWQAVNRWLLRSGWSIERMNRIRSCFSRLKGGGLARLLAPRSVEGLLISDVPGDDPAIIGSGLLVPAMLPEPEDWRRLPAALRQGVMPARHVTVVAEADGRIRQRVIASNRLARRRVVEASLGRLQAHPKALYCPVEVAAETLSSVQGATVAGGEPGVVLPPDHGRGGRNQHLALLMAQRLYQLRKPALFVSLGTDGTDGETEAAGAWVDHTTWIRAERAGLRPREALARYDAARVLEALGQTIRTGPTGTNVMDLMVVRPLAVGASAGP